MSALPADWSTKIILLIWKNLATSHVFIMIAFDIFTFFSGTSNHTVFISEPLRLKSRNISFCFRYRTKKIVKHVQCHLVYSHKDKGMIRRPHLWNCQLLSNMATRCRPWSATNRLLSESQQTPAGLRNVSAGGGENGDLSAKGVGLQQHKQEMQRPSGLNIWKQTRNVDTLISVAWSFWSIKKPLGI